LNTGISPIRNISSLDVYNNTFYDIGEMYYQPADGSSFSSFRQWNNILNSINISAERKSTNFYGPAAPTMSDYNGWQSGFPFSYANTLYSNLSDLQSKSNIDLHSQVLTCAFVNAGSDFRLASNSSCTTAGRVGGTVSGAVVELGAFGVTACVGHTCDRDAQPTPPPSDPPPSAPAAPTGLTIIR
jgi:hypothetical protein